MIGCPACGRPVETDRIGPRDTCEACFAWLHACRNCRLYEPGAHNDCREPAADVVADKEEGNFCDFFVPRDINEEEGTPPDREAKAALEDLFRNKKD